MDERLLDFVIAWILAPRGNNHAQLSEDNMLLIYAFKNEIQVYCHAIIYEVMLKAKR